MVRAGALETATDGEDNTEKTTDKQETTTNSQRTNKKVIHVMKIKTRKTNSYPGDKTTQIFAVRSNGDELGLMNLTPHNYQGRIYENDINGTLFRKVSEAKDYCKEHLIPDDFKDE